MRERHLIWALALFAPALIGNALMVVEDESIPFPVSCPDMISPSVYVDQVWFWNVSMLRVGNPGGSWLFTYENTSNPVSWNGRWQWMNGGGVFRCYRIWLIPALLHTTWAVSVSLDGYLVPTGGEDDACDEYATIIASSDTWGNDPYAKCWPGGWGTGGTSEGAGDIPDLTCSLEWITFEVYIEDVGWHLVWEGLATVCQEDE